jgi:hypothetical protein
MPPDEKPVTPVNGVTPTVEADLASDKAGEPRIDTPLPPPPGTIVPTFWQRESTKLALMVTLGLVISVLKVLITGETLERETLAVSVETFVWAWAGAFGLSRVSSDTLKWK